MLFYPIIFRCSSVLSGGCYVLVHTGYPLKKVIFHSYGTVYQRVKTKNGHFVVKTADICSFGDDSLKGPSLLVRYPAPWRLMSEPEGDLTTFPGIFDDSHVLNVLHPGITIYITT